MNDKLRSARKRRFGSIEKAAEACGVSEKSFQRWEQGQVRPQLGSLQYVTKAFGMTLDELGFSDLVGGQVRDDSSVVHASDLSVEIPSSSQEAVMFISKLGVQQPEERETMPSFDPTKRSTLEKLTQASGVLAASHLLQPEPWSALIAPKSTNQPQVLDANDLNYFADLVATCWNLSSAQLQSVERLLPIFLPSVEHTVTHPSEQQRLAASIACQAEILASIVALHHDDLLAMEVHRQRAVYYGHLSGDVNLYVTALVRLGTTYYYLQRPRKALETYQQTLPSLPRVTPLIQARTYIGLAEASARCGNVQDALTYRSKAHEVFPDRPADDPSALFADGGHGTLALWEALTYMELDQPEEAAAALILVKKKPAVLLPERVRAELTNHEAEAAIAQRRLDESAVLTREGVEGALKLGSQKRYSEAYRNFEAMKLLWRGEKRVKELEELFRR